MGRMRPCPLNRSQRESIHLSLYYDHNGGLEIEKFGLMSKQIKPMEMDASCDRMSFRAQKFLERMMGTVSGAANMWLCIPDVEREKECSYTGIGHGRQRDANGLLHRSCCHGL